MRFPPKIASDVAGLFIDSLVGDDEAAHVHTMMARTNMHPGSESQRRALGNMRDMQIGQIDTMTRTKPWLVSLERSMPLVTIVLSTVKHMRTRT